MVSLTPWQWFNLIACIVSTWATWWFINQADRFVAWLMPDYEFEKSLGWLNITATKRAEAGLRWVGYVVYATLAAALCGVVWSAEGLRGLAQWYEPDQLSTIVLHVPVLLVSLAIWFFYFAFGLMPRMRREREEREWEELQKFRAELEERERLRPTPPADRMNVPLKKPRINAPGESIMPDRGRRRR